MRCFTLGLVTFCCTYLSAQGSDNPVKASAKVKARIMKAFGGNATVPDPATVRYSYFADEEDY